MQPIDAMAMWGGGEFFRRQQDAGRHRNSDELNYCCMAWPCTFLGAGASTNVTTEKIPDGLEIPDEFRVVKRTPAARPSATPAVL